MMCCCLSELQYFLKVVPTKYTSLGNTTVATNQFSVTEHFL